MAVNLMLDWIMKTATNKLTEWILGSDERLGHVYQRTGLVFLSLATNAESNRISQHMLIRPLYGRFPESHFPGKTFPGKTFPGSRRMTSRINDKRPVRSIIRQFTQNTVKVCFTLKQWHTIFSGKMIFWETSFRKTSFRESDFPGNVR